MKEQHGYSVTLLTDEETALPRLQSLFCDEAVKNLSKDDRLLFYFAGHGVALDGDDGPTGFLIPQGARDILADDNTAQRIGKAGVPSHAGDS